MLELLTGAGLATSAGLNAALPLLALGALDRWTGLVTLPAGWEWLSNGWVLLIMAVLLVVDVVADKVPGVDHVNDLLQTVVRPTAGGIAFGAGVGTETVAVTDPGAFVQSGAWVPVVMGVVLALGVHVAKATARPVVNATTLGVGAPVVSVAEDVSAVLMVVMAIVIPVLVLVALVALGWGFWRLRRRRRVKARGAA